MWTETKLPRGPAPPKKGGPPTKTLRDEFAMAVLTGLVAYPHRVGEDNKPDHFARWSYALADAMLVARQAKP